MNTYLGKWIAYTGGFSGDHYVAFLSEVAQDGTPILNYGSGYTTGENPKLMHNIRLATEDEIATAIARRLRA